MAPPASINTYAGSPRVGTPRSATGRTPLLESGAAYRAQRSSKRRTWYLVFAVVLAFTSWLARKDEGRIFYAVRNAVFGIAPRETSSKIHIYTNSRGGSARQKAFGQPGYHSNPPGLAGGPRVSMPSNAGLPMFDGPKGGRLHAVAQDDVVESAFLPQPASRFARRAFEPRQALPTNPTCQPDMLLADFTSPVMTNAFGLGWQHEGLTAGPVSSNGRLEFSTTGGKAWILTELPCTSTGSAAADEAFFASYQKYSAISFRLTGPILGLPYGLSVKVCPNSPVLAGQSFYTTLTKSTNDTVATLSFSSLFGTPTGGILPQIQHIAWETLPASSYSLDDVKLKGDCHDRMSTGRLFDPGMGKFIYGASIPYDRDTPQDYIARLGGQVRPMLWNCYVVFSDHFPTHPMDRAAEHLLKLPYETILSVFAMPQSDGSLDAVTDEGIRQLGRACKRYNDLGLRILVNFGHEGNGYWYKYGGQPRKYREVWRRVSTIVRQIAGERTSLVWHMNSVIPNYWANGMQWDPELDTNGNGVLDQEDDPFTPYFPGPEYVDWVGLSFYHYGIEYPWKENYLPETPTKFRDGLDGRMGSNPARFYRMFAERYNIPMAVMETGAAYFVASDPGPGHLEMERAWWRQVYSRELFKELPLLRLIQWFEHEHPDEGTMRDYRVSADPEIAAAFLQDVPLDLISKPGDGVWDRSQGVI